MLDIAKIQRAIPQRYPMLMIDKIVELKSREYVEAVKQVSINELFFQGHFPDDPVMPGVMMIEAMAQTAVFLFYDSERPDEKLDFLLGAIKDVRFFKAVFPGDELKITAQPLRLGDDTVDVTTRVFVGEDKVVEARLIAVRRKGRQSDE
jgi:3-hydroxyacyl-[acyl-carrier-protein] dehydratase